MQTTNVWKNGQSNGQSILYTRVKQLEEWMATAAGERYKEEKVKPVCLRKKNTLHCWCGDKKDRGEGILMGRPKGSFSSRRMVDPSQTHPGCTSTDPSVTHPSRAHHEGDLSSDGEVLNHVSKGTSELPGSGRMVDPSRTHPGCRSMDPSMAHPSRAHHEDDFSDDGESLIHVLNEIKESPLRTHPGDLTENPSLAHHEGSSMDCREGISMGRPKGSSHSGGMVDPAWTHPGCMSQ